MMMSSTIPGSAPRLVRRREVHTVATMMPARMQSAYVWIEKTKSPIGNEMGICHSGGGLGMLANTTVSLAPASRRPRRELGGLPTDRVDAAVREGVDERGAHDRTVRVAEHVRDLRRRR